MSLRKIFRALVAAGLLVSAGAGAETFVVNTTELGSDGVCSPEPGGCTLVEAIEAANTAEGFDTVRFDPAVFPIGDPGIISPSSELPAFDDPLGVAVDGSGAGVVLDGANLGGLEDGLQIVGKSGESLLRVEVRHLTIRGFGRDGLRICAGGFTCEENLSDVSVSRVTVLDVGSFGFRVTGNDLSGIRIHASTGLRSGLSGILVSANGTLRRASFRGIHVSDSGHSGLSVSAEGEVTGLSIASVSSTHNAHHGILIESGRMVGSRIEGIVSTANGSGGLGVGARTDLLETKIRDAVTSSNGSSGLGVGSGGLNLGTSIRNVTSVGNASAGITVGGGEAGHVGTEIRDSRAIGNSQGFSISGRRNQLSNLVASGNTFHGIILGFDGVPAGENRLRQIRAQGNGSTGIYVPEANTGNRIQRVEAFGNGDFDLEDANPDCADNRWRQNVFGTANRACIE